MADPGSGEHWEWQTLGVANPGRDGPWKWWTPIIAIICGSQLNSGYVYCPCVDLLDSCLVRFMSAAKVFNQYVPTSNSTALSNWWSLKVNSRDAYCAYPTSESVKWFQHFCTIQDFQECWPDYGNWWHFILWWFSYWTIIAIYRPLTI